MRRRDRGAVTIELIILFGFGVIPFFLAVVVSGRLTLAQQAADAAAFDAARTASISLDESSARIRAGEAALRSFQSQGIQCVSLTVDLNTDGFKVPEGQPATVSARVTCDARLSDLAVPLLPLPAGITLSADFTSPLDRYRTRVGA
jgi:Flp pilus assembly protein TadG